MRSVPPPWSRSSRGSRRRCTCSLEISGETRAAHPLRPAAAHARHSRDPVSSVSPIPDQLAAGTARSGHEPAYADLTQTGIEQSPSFFSGLIAMLKVHCRREPVHGDDFALLVAACGKGTIWAPHIARAKATPNGSAQAGAAVRSRRLAGSLQRGLLNGSLLMGGKPCRVETKSGPTDTSTGRSPCATGPGHQ